MLVQLFATPNGGKNRIIRSCILIMAKELSFPFYLDLATLDTSSITNILNDIETHLPLMETEDDLTQLLQVKEFFEKELMAARRRH